MVGTQYTREVLVGSLLTMLKASLYSYDVDYQSAMLVDMSQIYVVLTARDKIAPVHKK